MFKMLTFMFFTKRRQKLKGIKVTGVTNYHKYLIPIKLINTPSSPPHMY